MEQASNSNTSLHLGEIALRKHAGIVETTRDAGAHAIHCQIPDECRRFFPTLPFIVAGIVDIHGAAWATVLAGTPGFARTYDAMTLRVSADTEPSDPARTGFKHGDTIGILGIEQMSRTRHRVNGTIHRIDDKVFDIDVHQCFSNCPQYIYLRDPYFSPDRAASTNGLAYPLAGFNQRSRALIENADTLFVASYFDGKCKREVDVSHKGGRPGFIKITDGAELLIPDFAGAHHFNTLGNIYVNPRCGLLLIDFETGDVLQLTGTGKVILNSPEIAAFRGAERLLKFKPQSMVFRPGAVPLKWTTRLQGASRSAGTTGTWQAADARLYATLLQAAHGEGREGPREE